LYHLNRHSEWSNTNKQRNCNACIQSEGVTIWRHLYDRECCLYVSVCLSVCGSHNSSAWNNGSSLGQLWYVQQQIKSKQVHGKWDGPWRADTLIWNHDNFSDSVYTTLVYWYNNSFCLQINAICFSFCTRTKHKSSYHIT
jgi:hypothetical protein